MINITSGQNPMVREVRSLKNPKGRQETGLFFVEGTRIFEEAVNSDLEIEYVVISEKFSETPGYENALSLIKDGCKVYGVTDKLFDEMSDTETPQGILAVLRLRRPSVDEINDRNGLYIFLDEIRDPGNMGTIIRTADAAGFTGVIVSKGCTDVYNPKVLRSTMGSIFHIPVYFCGTDETADGLRHLRQIGIKILASHLEGSLSIFDTDLTKGTVIIIGSEAAGIGEASKNEADVLVSIPMEGRAESLNASVAAGIMMFEAVRQRVSNGIHT